MQIHYCDGCGIRMDLTSDPFVTIGDRTVCAKCGAAQGLAAKSAPTAKQSGTKNPSPPKESPRTSQRARTTVPESPARPLNWVLGGVVVVMVVVVGVLATRSGPAPAPQATLKDAVAPSIEPPKPPVVVDTTQKANAEAGVREFKASEAWREAEEHFNAQRWGEAKSAYEAFQRDFEKTDFGIKQADQVPLRLAAIVATLNPVFVMPKNWRGSKENSAKGNPYFVGGVAVWRLDQIWPADPLDVKNYRPLAWVKNSWQALENSGGGQPVAGFKGEDLQISNRSAGLPEQKNARLAALTFIAPARGRYEFRADVKPTILDGAAKLEIVVYKREGGRIERIDSAGLENKKTRYGKFTFPLAAGDELIFLPTFKPGTGECAADFLFDRFKVTFEPTK